MAQTGPKPYAKAHETINGPGDGRPTALQILEDEGLVGKMTDKTFLVTGGTAGIGLETVRVLSKTGAHVFFTARNEEKGKQTATKLTEENESNGNGSSGKIECVVMDNCNLKSVKEGAEDLLRRTDRLDVLVCNAGISQKPYAVSSDGFEETFATNHLAHFYLFHLLKPLLLRSSSPSFNSRLVVVASASHQYSTVQLGNYGLDSPPKEWYHPWGAMEDDQIHNPTILYGSSKTANIWFANEVDRRYGKQGLHALSLHPGVVGTGGFGTLDPRVLEKLKPHMGDMEMLKNFKSVEQGAATSVIAAVGKEFEGLGGLFLDNCGVGDLLTEDFLPGVKGHFAYINDREGEARLWRDSLGMLGLEDDVR